jgi:hypothetical protein
LIGYVFDLVLKARFIRFIARFLSVWEWIQRISLLVIRSRSFFVRGVFDFFYLIALAERAQIFLLLHVVLCKSIHFVRFYHVYIWR